MASNPRRRLQTGLEQNKLDLLSLIWQIDNVVGVQLLAATRPDVHRQIHGDFVTSSPQPAVDFGVRLFRNLKPPKIYE